jgi:hypothetical protein
MKRSLRIIAGGTIAALALTVGLGATAGASTATTGAASSFLRHRQECLRSVDHRITGLQLTQYRINVSRLTADQKASLDANIQPTIDELNTTYRDAILAAVTPAQLQSACQQVVVNLRIWVVFLPQVVDTAILDGLGNWRDSLQAKVNTIAAGGGDVAALQAQLDDAAAKMTDATNITVSITPSSFNADPSGTVAQWGHVHDDLVAAFVDLAHVQAAIRT